VNPRHVPAASPGWTARLLLAAGLAVAAVATGWPLASDPTPGADAAGPSVPVPLDGSWQTFANGDRIRQLLRDGDSAWAATEGGGLVHWNLTTGSWRQYLAPQDQLPSNDVNALVRDTSGGLWLATERGLVLFTPESAAVRVFTPASSPGMPSRVVRALTLAPDGRLWVGFGQGWDPDAIDPSSRRPGTFLPGGLARFDPASGVWDEFFHAEPKSASPLNPDGGETFKNIPSENVTAVELGSDGILWVGTQPYYVFERYSCPPADPSCQNGGNWVLAGGGLAARQNDQWANWIPSVAEQSCFSNHVTDLEPDEKGLMWVGTAGRGLLLMQDGLRKLGCRGGQAVWLRPSRNRPGPRGNYVWSIDVAEDGRVWIGNGDGREDGLGVGVLEHNGSFDTTLDDSWEYFDLDNGPVENHAAITAILAAGSQGPALVGTVDDFDGDGWGLRSYDPQTTVWRPYRTADSGLPSNHITALAHDAAHGVTWFGTARRGLARFDGTSWRSWRSFGRGRQVAKVTEAALAGLGRVPMDIPDQATFDAAFPDQPRYVRIGDDPTLYRLTRSNITVVGGKRYLDVTPKLTRDLLPGTPVYNVERGPASNSVTSIAYSPDGTVWVGGLKDTWLGTTCPAEWGTNCWLDGGLSRYDGQRWTTYDEHTKDKNGKTLPEQSVQSLLVAGDGQVWAGTGDIRGGYGVGIGVLDPVAGTWSVHPTSRSMAFAGMGVSGLAQDPATTAVWAAHHSAEDCVPVTGRTSCTWVRYGGGVSRWNGTKWDIWQKPAAPLRAYGRDGEVRSIAVDAARGRVWAGGWDGNETTFHWALGLNIDAAVNWCPLDCTNAAWQSRVWPGEGEVVALALDDSGNLWAGVNRSGNGIVPPAAGVKVYDGAEWRTYNAANSGLAASEVSALARMGQRMWVGTLARGVSLYQRYVPPTPTPSPTETLPPSVTPTPTETGTPTLTPDGTLTPTPTGPSPTATRSPVTPSATPRETSVGPRLYYAYLPFAQQPRRCVSCPTPTPRRTATPGR
jgi:hypothetical protein